MNNRAFGKVTYFVAVFCIAAAVTSHAQTFTTLWVINGDQGLFPGTPVQGVNGNFYGVSGLGGPDYWGTAFEVTPEGKFTVFYNFCVQANCADGAYPYGSLALGTNGDFYGATFSGGAPNQGTVYELSTAGKLTNLYTFCSQPKCADGSSPLAGLTQGANGNYYGTTFYGGANSGVSGSGGGVLFEISQAGKYKVLYSFCALANCADGANPYFAPVQGTNGDVYGTTSGGGTNGDGTIYAISPSGKFRTLYSFTPESGMSPLGLIQASDGNLYGVTARGGPTDSGSIFKITPAGKFTTLYEFCTQAGCPDGDFPSALVEGSDGNFYGTTGGGGTGLPVCPNIGCGTIFKITPAGELTTLHSFCSEIGCPDGTNPQLPLLATNGVFYGTTQEGSALGDGTVWSLSTGLPPFVQALPNFAKAGRVIGILGNNLTGTTSVTFNKTPATFTVASNNLIKATVPTGATTGTIAVTTPGGTLNSNVAFQVLP